MSPLFEIKNCHAGYGNIRVLKNISLHVNHGEIVTIIGANGAGKTTTLLTATRIVPIQEGEVSFDGHNISNLPAHELVTLGLAHVPEGRKIFSRLTVEENLELGAYTVNDPALISKRKKEVCDLFPILRDRAQQLGGTLSGGEQQMLAIARSLMSGPKLLLLDEPSMGVAPLLVQKIFETIVELNRQGMTILLVEQNANAALAIAHRGYVLETGEITHSDSGSNLLRDPKVLEAYLGA